MSIKGSTSAVIARQIAGGHLSTALITVREWKPDEVPLDVALGLVILVICLDPDPQSGERFTRRWLLRWLGDRRRTWDLAEHRALVDALDELPGAAALTALDDWCARHRLGVARSAAAHVAGLDPSIVH